MLRWESADKGNVYEWLKLVVRCIMQYCGLWPLGQ